MVHLYAPFHSTGSEVRKGCFRASSADIHRPGCMTSNASNLVGKVVGTEVGPHFLFLSDRRGVTGYKT
jgi:hypothetical protein